MKFSELAEHLLADEKFLERYDPKEVPWRLYEIVGSSLDSPRYDDEALEIERLEDIQQFFGRYFKESLTTANSSSFDPPSPLYVYLLSTRALAIKLYINDRTEEALNTLRS